jgi:hypothetical protein
MVDVESRQQISNPCSVKHMFRPIKTTLLAPIWEIALCCSGVPCSLEVRVLEIAKWQQRQDRYQILVRIEEPHPPTSQTINF